MNGRPALARRRQCLLALAPLATVLALGLAGPAQAQAGPKGKVVLSISSKGGAPADFDMAMLEALPQHSFTTATPWYQGPRKFSGPLLRDVLAAAKAQGSTISAVALNNYKVDLPYDDAQKFKVLVATRLDDKPMSVREKGPLFIVYPFDESADLRSERYYSRSAWQLRALEVK